MMPQNACRMLHLYMKSLLITGSHFLTQQMCGHDIQWWPHSAAATAVSIWIQHWSWRFCRTPTSPRFSPFPPLVVALKIPRVDLFFKFSAMGLFTRGPRSYRIHPKLERQNNGCVSRQTLGCVSYLGVTFTWVNTVCCPPPSEILTPDTFLHRKNLSGQRCRLVNSS